MWCVGGSLDGECRIPFTGTVTSTLISDLVFRIFVSGA